ncbi:MAG: gliding motility protein GldL [Bacteroidaceae bacterium]|nr:gliding motility protein GldL [Bacteroidaceae bacterium]
MENKKKNFIHTVQNFIASYQGKVLLNYAYSWGAAIVILGALFKLTHLPSANVMLFIGMGTEVLVFAISGFDRPSKAYKWESVFPQIKIAGSSSDHKATEELKEATQRGLDQTQMGQPATGAPASTTASAAPNASAAAVPGVEVSDEMISATQQYLDQLQQMTSALGNFTEQTKRMGQDADQMDMLSKNLSGINAIYEIQLRSVSSQLSTIDKINEQSKLMAQQIDELNVVYARMLDAMTINNK